MFSLYNVDFLCYSYFLVVPAKGEAPDEQLAAACGLQAMPELLYLMRRIK
jgi:hypothetical protein